MAAWIDNIYPRDGKEESEGVFALGKNDEMTGMKEKILYVGPSMNPTLKASDLILLERVEEVCAGDVVVFRPPGSHRSVVHRVIKVNKKGIMTQGDNNGESDPWLLPFGAVMGRVGTVLRGRRKKSVYGGFQGRVYGRAIRGLNQAAKFSKRIAFACCWPPCRFLILARVRRIKKYMRFISIERAAGAEIQLIIAGLVAARLMPGEERWRIRRRFRIIVDEADLPYICGSEVVGGRPKKKVHNHNERNDDVRQTCLH